MFPGIGYVMQPGMNPFASSHGEQATKGKNCQRETYARRTSSPGLPGLGFMLGCRQRPRKSGGGHGPGRNCCRHRRAVAPSAPCVRPRSSVAAHGRPDSIRREQLGLVGAVGGGCSRRTRARAEMFRTKADPTKRELQDDPAPGRTTKTQDLKDHSHLASNPRVIEKSSNAGGLFRAAGVVA